MKHFKLPHIDIDQHYQFITFRTLDSLDNYLDKLNNSNNSNKKKQLLTDNYLDRSEKGAHLYGDAIKICRDVILNKDHEMYDTIAFSIMPNHVHLLIIQKEQLGKTIKYIKANCAIQINKLLDKSGSLWAKDYYDRAIRDDGHLQLTYDYILNNPYKANLPDADVRVYSVH